jgi:hypothetical protein
MATLISKFLHTEFRALDPSLAVTKPVTIILGVGEKAATELKKLDIETVFDLASSTLFANASKLIDAAEKPESEIARIGSAPLDMIDTAAATIPVNELQLEPVSSMRELTPLVAGDLSMALGITTIRDLALWPPYHAARMIVNAALGGTHEVENDNKVPSDLVPASGRYPTERVHYDTIILEKIHVKTTSSRRAPSMASEAGRTIAARDDLGDGQGRRPIEDEGPVNISDVISNPNLGFKHIATGALLTYTQSWYTIGLSLGQLLHSVALAPGESTRIAMIDWRRQTMARAGETITETEALASRLDYNRSINEVADAVAEEKQKGEAESLGFGSALSMGEASGAALGGELGMFKGAAGAGRSLGFSAGAGFAKSWASSYGKRDIHAEMTQTINGATQQASSSVRNRWATAIREVSQSEAERISTRALTNYNHMHALTIQYYEVVQLYRTVLELMRVTRCLFVPMKLIDFQKPYILARFRRAIAAAGLIIRVRSLLFAEPNSLVVSAPRRAEPWPAWVLDFGREIVGEQVGLQDSPSLFFPLSETEFEFAGLSINDTNAPFSSVIFENRDGRIREITLRVRGQNDVDPHGPLRIFATDLFSKPQATDSVAFEKARQAAIEEFLRLRRIVLKKKQGQESFTGRVPVSLELSFPEPSWEPALDIPFFRVTATIDVPAGDSTVVAFELAHTIGDQELIDHLMENQLHYSQAVWRSLDSSTISLLMSNYTFAGESLSDVIDPVPVGAAGNYLIFKMYEEENESWQKFLTDKKLTVGRKSETIVPLPTGGVFGEAVLGRANSAEKLDITRFWNWQDSPIQIPAPEIAALQSGSRAQPEDLKPGQLGQPILNIVNSPSMPDPTGMASILTAIQNGNMFRDMSGLLGTIGFAQAAMGRAFQGAKDAAAQAGQNMKTAVDLFKAAFGRNLGAGGDENGNAKVDQMTGTPSNMGAMINAAKDLDQRETGSYAREGSDPSEWSQWPGDNSEGLTPPPLVSAENERSVLHGTKPSRPAKKTAEVQVILRTFVIGPGYSKDNSPPLNGIVELGFFKPGASGQNVIETPVTFDVINGVASSLITLNTRTTYGIHGNVKISPGTQTVLTALKTAMPGIDLPKLVEAVDKAISIDLDELLSGEFVRVSPDTDLISLNLEANIVKDENKKVTLKIDNTMGYKVSADGKIEFDSSKLADFAKALAKKIEDAKAKAFTEFIGALTSAFTLSFVMKTQATTSGNIEVIDKLEIVPAYVQNIRITKGNAPLS